MNTKLCTYVNQLAFLVLFSFLINLQFYQARAFQIPQ